MKKIVIAWQPLEQSWRKRAQRNVMPVLSILVESATSIVKDHFVDVSAMIEVGKSEGEPVVSDLTFDISIDSGGIKASRKFEEAMEAEVQLGKKVEAIRGILDL